MWEKGADGGGWGFRREYKGHLRAGAAIGEVFCCCRRQDEDKKWFSHLFSKKRCLGVEGMGNLVVIYQPLLYYQSDEWLCLA
jgi:hypothetical protein